VTGLTAGDVVLLLAAGLGAGTVNGVAGGGTLVSFPALLATGMPALQANVTSTVGIWPGYLGGVAGFRSEVREQPRRRLGVLSGAAMVGAAVGSVLLLVTPVGAFKALAPYLVLAACLLFAVQPLISRWVKDRLAEVADGHLRVAAAGTLLGSVYGGYFGAGLGVILLALLGLTLPDDLVRTNGLRAVLSLVVNCMAAAVFLVAAHVAWPDAGLLAGSSLVGGYFGARLARRLPPIVFRVLVVVLGLVTSARLLAG
jgi:uncharacterized membrane protein YfcA